MFCIFNSEKTPLKLAVVVKRKHVQLPRLENDDFRRFDTDFGNR